MFLLIVVLIVLFLIFRIGLLSNRFFNTAGTAIDLYNILQEVSKMIIKDEKSFSNQKIFIDYDIYHYEFNNMNDAYIAVEGMCNKALRYYNILYSLGHTSIEIRNEKDNLIDICNKIRMIRWQNQEDVQ